MGKMETRGDFPAVEGSRLVLLHLCLFLSRLWQLNPGFPWWDWIISRLGRGQWGLVGAHPISQGAVAFPALPTHTQPLGMCFN